MNWRGRPLTSYRVIVDAHRRHYHPQRNAGANAGLDNGTHSTGLKLSDALIAALPFTGHDLHGDWNYCSTHQSTVRGFPFRYPDPLAGTGCCGAAGPKTTASRGRPLPGVPKWKPLLHRNRVLFTGKP